MWPVTQRFLDTLSRSHVQKSYIEILKGGTVVRTFEGGLILDPTTGDTVYSIGGTINVEKATIRRSGSIQLVDPGGQLSPVGAESLFALYSTEVRVWMGVRYWDAPLYGGQADTEYVPVGTFVLTQFESSYPTITMGLTDRFWYLDNFQSPWTILAGMTQGEALNTLLTLKMPSGSLDNQLNTSVFANVLPELTFDADSPVVDALQKIANYSGQQIFCNPMGSVVNDMESKTTDQPVMVYASGPRSMLMRPSRTTGSGPVYNAVVMTSESGSIAPLRGFAVDRNPDSMTNADRIGVRPLFASDPLITTQGQADESARNKLKSILGISDAYSVPIIPNFALESQDVIQVTDETTTVDQPMIVDSFPVPLRATDGAMTLTCRVDVINPVTPS